MVQAIATNFYLTGNRAISIFQGDATELFCGPRCKLEIQARLQCQRE